MINNRSGFGQWEIDLVQGKKTKEEAVVLTLVEHQTRFALACKFPNKQAETINEAIKELLMEYPISTINSDNSGEFNLLYDLEDVDNLLCASLLSS
ncbi:TPA: hypothetical protein TUM56_001983 [Streptococcus equi subsp. zooepidemicus]|nr:hypothetical protein [Streptococcus equi subsp. zooepidemicus]MCD3374952.1 hypothetical protein [Streptococcus equi subsp. zooepidemicus]MCD3447487.1 hypothetical protein [Streptococcus equi subsp. zooepidemicus]MCD3468438.1 hypothetical protein [Streptococcus equi subsp. zooepidemicus]UFR19249.1 hypothetical protein KV238_04485 [Streptococcus equi subsp. zooepidemicus]